MAKKKSFVLHDESVNTYGFRMLTDGADLTEFIKNPVMLLNHNDWSLPIGRWENIRKEGGKILADPVFNLKDERGKEVAQQVEDDFMRMASIGAWPPLELSDAPELMLEGQRHPTVTKWVVREASIVTIGSNHNALCFYDDKGDKVELSDPSTVIRLFDVQKPNHNNDNMSVLNTMLKLADNAGETERVAAIQAMIDDNIALKDTNKLLNDQITGYKQKEKADNDAKAILLVDAAVKDGRINADAKDKFIKLFDADYDNAQGILEGLPKRKSVTEQIDKQDAKVELKDLQEASWDKLDKEGKLIMLKDSYPDLYAEKYEKKFGVKPGK